MKIAVSAMGKSLESPFEPRFGRASGFVIFDTETNQIEYLDNSVSQSLPQGAGIQSAQMIMDSGALVLITGNIGPRASQALENSNLEIFSCEADTVSEAIQSYQSGLTSSSKPGKVPGDSRTQKGQGKDKPGRGIGGGGRGIGGGARGRGPGQGGRGMGGGGGKGTG